ncbi:hypothetical protein E2562_001201 [Oryza meyeriana var. granulata]|uniref:Uncharacterized protein n=1 Tax=Oryza meyeriana var. granulata TaxID=110450 RepID=A0A6G1DB02_9ORYZ|nr:hypothetical protein E2562_001201 [Oryza meyeriana var. granulata]
MTATKKRQIIHLACVEQKKATSCSSGDVEARRAGGGKRRSGEPLRDGGEGRGDPGEGSGGAPFWADGGREGDEGVDTGAS